MYQGDISTIPLLKIQQIMFSAVRNDRNKKRGKEKDGKSGEGSPGSSTSPGQTPDDIVVTSEIESVVSTVSQAHIDTFPLTQTLSKYNAAVSYDTIIMVYYFIIFVLMQD